MKNLTEAPQRELQPQPRRRMLPLLFLTLFVAILCALVVVIALLWQLLNRAPTVVGLAGPTSTVATLDPRTGSPPPPGSSPSAAPQASQPAGQAADCAALQFTDDFQGDLKPEWKRIEGTPVIINGRLGSATDDMTLEIGDQLCNFTVDLDFDGGNCCSVAFFLKIDNKLAYGFTTNYQSWQTHDSNEWLEIARGEGLDTSGHMQFRVEGTAYTVFFNGTQVMQINYGSPQRSPFLLKVFRGAEIDNFSITAQ